MGREMNGVIEEEVFTASETWGDPKEIYKRIMDAYFEGIPIMLIYRSTRYFLRSWSGNREDQFMLTWESLSDDHHIYKMEIPRKRGRGW